MFTLEELNDSNYNELSKLKISDEQKEFVLDFDGCINYQKENPFLKLYGIKKDDTYIGMTAFARWDSDTSIPVEKRWVWFDEFFLDLKYQGHGYGKELVQMILNKIQDIYHPKFVVLSVKNNNERAKTLYRHYGFKDTNIVYHMDDDSISIEETIGPEEEFIMIYTY